MKYLVLLLALVTATSAFADVVEVNDTLIVDRKVFNTIAAATKKDEGKASLRRFRRYVCTPFTIRFPWGTCRTKQCGYSTCPLRVRGNACGTQVYCLRVGHSCSRYKCIF